MRCNAEGRRRTNIPWVFTDLRAVYIKCTLKRSPDVSHTQGLADRSIAIREGNGVTVEQFCAIDHDIATGVWPDSDVFLSIEHAAAMQRALRRSQLAVVPGTSHAVPMEKPELVNRLILDFLAEEQVEKRFKL